MGEVGLFNHAPWEGRRGADKKICARLRPVSSSWFGRGPRCRGFFFGADDSNCGAACGTALPGGPDPTSRFWAVAFGPFCPRDRFAVLPMSCLWARVTLSREEGVSVL